MAARSGGRLDVFARGTDDSVSITLNGKLLDTGNDSIEVELLRNDTLVRKFTASRRVQRSINFAAERFPSGTIQRVGAGVDSLREDVLS